MRATFLRRILAVLGIAWFGLAMAAPAPDQTQLAVWANEAIVATYTFDYKNYMPRQKEIAKYFTSEAWLKYLKALNASGLDKTVIKMSYSVDAVAALPPKITSLGSNHWAAIMPLKVFYKNAEGQQKQSLEVKIIFAAVPGNQGVRGLAIKSLQSKVTAEPCKCQAAEPSPAAPSPAASSPDAKEASGPTKAK